MAKSGEWDMEKRRKCKEKGQSAGMKDRYGFDVTELRVRNILGKNMSLIRKHARMSQKELSSYLKEMGINLTPGALSRWENGDALPNAYQLIAWCRVFNIEDILSTLFDSDPLLPISTSDATEVKTDAGSSEGVPITGSTEGDLSIHLNARGEGLLREIREAFAASGKYTLAGSAAMPYGDRGAIQLKIYNQSAAAGTGDFLDDEDFELVDFSRIHVPDGTDFGIRISGDSMEPFYTDGQIAMVERCHELADGDIGIFIYNGNAYIKQYIEQDPPAAKLDDFTDSYGMVHRMIILHSLNTAYGDIEIAPDGEFCIIGRVLN